MDERDAPESTATATPDAPLSLKSITQQLLLDTLDPHERVQIAAQSLSGISQDDLTGIPLVALQRGVAAHAAVPINQALLKYLPQLRGRIRAVDHINHSVERELFGEQSSYTTVTTTYAVEIGQGVTKTLVVDTDHGRIETHSDGVIWYKAKLHYEGVKAAFASTTSTRNSDSYLSTSNLKEFFSTLADDLKLPTTSSPTTEAREAEHAQAQDETRARLRREEQAAKAAHKSPNKRCDYYCQRCLWAEEDLQSGLDLLDPPRIEYTLPELQTSDAKQCEITFGRLVRGLFPQRFRTEDEAHFSLTLDFTEAGEFDVEQLLRGAAVAGVDLKESGFA
ncbi:hypothetical protein RQP46_008938 [Phenoliferia psychrophenolica]